jgi:hypothetical protein
MVFSSGPMAVARPSLQGVHDRYPVNMFRTRETYTFDLVDDTATGQNRIPCRIEITTSRSTSDVDPCNPIIDAISDARLSITTRSVITSWVAENVNGRPIDGPVFGAGETNHVPEHIAVRAYWLASDQSKYERKVTRWALTVESARVVIADQWMVEYAPSVGGR